MVVAEEHLCTARNFGVARRGIWLEPDDCNLCYLCMSVGPHRLPEAYQLKVSDTSFQAKAEPLSDESAVCMTVPSPTQKFTEEARKALPHLHLQNEHRYLRVLPFDIRDLYNTPPTGAQQDGIAICLAVGPFCTLYMSSLIRCSLTQLSTQLNQAVCEGGTVAPMHADQGMSSPLTSPRLPHSGQRSGRGPPVRA